MIYTVAHRRTPGSPLIQSQRRKIFRLLKRVYAVDEDAYLKRALGGASACATSRRHASKIGRQELNGRCNSSSAVLALGEHGRASQNREAGLPTY